MENLTDLVLVYRDMFDIEHYQPAADLMEVGTLIDPDTGEDLELVGWKRA